MRENQGCGRICPDRVQHLRSFGGINLEDIAAPRCFEIERKLKEKCDIPIFHDDQHGTAVITLAGLTNALKVVGKAKEEVKIVTSGAGAAAVSIVKLLLSSGYRNITMCDRQGMIYAGRPGLNWIKEEMAQATNLDKQSGTLADALKGADVFIGVSAPGTVTREMVASMNRDPIIFACANPTPEIFPDEAKAGGARIIATGRSDFPQPDQQRAGLPRHLPGHLRRAGQGYQRGDEDRRGGSPGRPDLPGRAFGGLHHSPCL